MPPSSTPKTPPDYDDLADLIRQVGPALVRIDRRLTNVEANVADLQIGVTKLEAEVAGTNHRLDLLEMKLTSRIEAVELKLGGRIHGLEGRMAGIEQAMRYIPNVWMQAGLIIATFGFAFALLRFGLPH